jgi:heme exporter protein A
MPLELVCQDVAAERGGRTVFEGVSAAVSGGQVLLLTGPNGAGKTTLLRLIAGLLAPLAGRVMLHGVSNEVPLAESVHLLGHLSGVKRDLTVGENLAFWCRYLGGQADAVGPALDRLGLHSLADVPASYLSAGQQRRLALARLVVAERPVWLLDEPGVALDQAGMGALTDLVHRHVERGRIVVAATHQPLGFRNARELALGRRPSAS